ncbi:unnamed protein product [Linum trigynum]|uniref:MATH domain-containing protein n=1 Tax=Linum trigynum TaxID=586398 RepID=A0AAV2DC82_9ROSI
MEVAEERRKRAKEDTEKFTWTIPHFSKLNVNNLDSDIFAAGGRKWRIVLYPKAGGGRFISAYLRLVSSPPQAGCAPPIQCTLFRLTLVDQINCHSLTKVAEHEFVAGNLHSGFWPFVLHSQLYNPCKGFLVNDTVIFEAEVSKKGASLPGVARHCGSAQRTVADQPAVAANSPAEPEVQLVSRNLMAELASVASRMKSTAADEIANSSSCSGSSLLRKQKEELFRFLNKSLEDIHKSNSSNNVEEIALRIADETTDPIEQMILEDLVSEFKKSFFYIQNVHDAETFMVHAKHVEARLIHRGKQLSCLEAEVSRLGEEEMELDAKIQQLLACKAKIRDDKSSTIAEMEKLNLTASRELKELKQQSKRASENRSALAQFNAWWKILKENLGSRSG